MDFYVGPAVLTFGGTTLGVTAFIDSSAARGAHTWGGFLGVPESDGISSAASADRVQLALPGRTALEIDITDILHDGVGFLGAGPSPLPPSANA